ncbi:MAG TPA: hypothetical protein VLT59_00690 [Steroidobacteraceae bacterium]|nr:hypothetical protein [Steroidobacteraceae bacterium]
MTTVTRFRTAAISAAYGALACTFLVLPAVAENSEATAHEDLGFRATQQVGTALQQKIDSQVAASVTEDVTPVARSAEAERPASARTRVATQKPPARAAVEHTRVYIAIKDGAQNGVLVQ